MKNDDISNRLLELQLGKLDDASILSLATRLISCDDNDKLENFFRSLSNSQYKYLEKTDYQLAESLIIRLQEYYTSQMWVFGYTDTIGNNCKRLYDLSNDIIVKANLLFTIIKVGMSHNRWHVMSLASNLLKSSISSVPECTELAILLSKQNVYLEDLGIEKSFLPLCLQQHYKRTF